MRFGVILLIIFLMGPLAGAQPIVGKKAAMKYFQPRSKSSVARRPALAGPHDKQLALSAGAYFKGKSYEWLGEEVGGWSAQLDYRRRGTADSYFSKAYQFELHKYQFSQNELSKVSFLWNVIFPRSLSFPVYMGIGMGPGVFLSQWGAKSWLSFDYKAYLGLRFSDKHSQFFIEGGVKNHLLVLSSGQFTGAFVSSGVAYKF